MLSRLLSNAVSTFSLFLVVSAWNTDVHNQIGFMAEEFLNPSTVSIIHQILEPQYNGSIGQAAAWADAYAHTKEGQFSYQWHWIDSADAPPASCSLYYNRDCSLGGCNVQAIANQTQILKSCIASVKSGELTNGTDLNCSYALKWLTHFFGDITQPLHASGLAAGGNAIPVTFDNRSTELHAVWDGSIIYSRASVYRFSNTSLSPYMAGLVSRIKDDTFFSPVASWLACTDPSTPIECALSWARESNAWTCDYVYSQVYKGVDLYTSGYAKGAYPIVELQVSKGARRLAEWLNRLVAGDYKWDREVVLETWPAWLGPTAGVGEGGGLWEQQGQQVL